VRLAKQFLVWASNVAGDEYYILQQLHLLPST
jgi:hypothetical protein